MLVADAPPATPVTSPPTPPIMPVNVQFDALQNNGQGYPPHCRLFCRIQVHRAQLDRRDQRDHKDPLARKGRSEYKVQPELLERQVRLARQALREQTAPAAPTGRASPFEKRDVCALLQPRGQRESHALL
jgi:hypothetical protein